jgi:hypothetical protein
METTKENLKETIKRLALRNLDKEPAFNCEKQKLAELHDELRKARDEYQNIRGQYGKYLLKICLFFFKLNF